MLEVLLLGPVEVRRDGSAVPLGGGKQQTILARLALAEGRIVPVPVLVQDLWGEHPPADPAHALQAHVSRLRRVFPRGLEWLSGGYRLDPEEIRVDLAAFEELASAGRECLGSGEAHAARRHLRDALALWRGPALGAIAEVEGLRPLAVRLEELRHLAIADRVEADLGCGAEAEVVPELRGLLEENPLRERHWGQLMVALFKTGRANEAIDTFGQARAVFAERLGTEPGRDLHRLHEALLRGSLPEEHLTSTGGAVAGQSATIGEPALPSALSAEFDRRARAPLAGRRRELAVLDGAREQARGRLRVVTLSGDPGIGKTRLAADFAARRVEPGTRVLFGRSDRSVSTPYQPFVEMLRTELLDCSEEHVAARLGPAPAVLAALVPERAGHLLADTVVADRDANTEQHLIFDALAGWLEQLAARGPLLVVVDDVQWADHQTLLFLRHLTRTPRQLPLLLLTTLRDRGLPAGEATDPLFESLLRQSETTTHLHLGGLDDEEVSQLLRAEVASTAPSVEVDPALVAWASRAAGGNPLFVVELARGWGSSEVGHAASDAPPLPVGLREVVRRRLDDLPGGVRDLLQQAAVIGSIFDLTVLERVTGRERAEVDALVQRARHARLLEPVAGSPLRLAFSHEVVHGVLLEMLSPWQRVDQHRRVAAAIEVVHARRLPDHFRELSHHYVQASADGSDDSVGAACHYLRLAAQRALTQGAPWLAVEDGRRLLDLLGEGADVGPRCDALTALGIAQFHAADPTYRDTLLVAARLAHDVGDHQRLAEAVVANSRGWWSDTTALDEDRLLLIEAALEAAEVDDPALRALLLSAWAQESVRDPARRELAVRRSAQALEEAEEIGDEAVIARVLSLRYAVVYASFSDPWECVDISERLFELAGRRADPRLQFEAAIGLAQSAMMMGEFTVTDRALERCADLGEVLEQPARVWLTRCWQSMCVAMRGDLETAEEMAVSALELGTDSGQPDALTWFAGQLFTFRMLQGRLPEIHEEVEAQVAAYAGAIPAWRAAHALAMTTVGREPEAEAVLVEFAEQGFAPLPTDLLWLHGMSYLCGVCHAIERNDLAPALYRTLAPYAGLVAHNGTIDAGPVDLHLARMARLAGWPDVAEKHRDAALQLCRRIDAPLWLAQARAC